MARFGIRPRAWREINSQLDYLEEEAGLETAKPDSVEIIHVFQCARDIGALLEKTA